MARAAYASPAAPIRSQQSTEYEVLAQVTGRLKTAIATGAAGFAALVAAVHDNRRLWTLLAVEVASPQNALPESLRAQIFYLAEFTLQHSTKVLEGAAGADVLVEINTAIMRGLRQQEAAG